MDFDWQTLLDFVVQCEDKHQQSNDLTSPESLVLEQHQPFTSEPLDCKLEPYNVETVSQASSNDGGDFLGYSYYEEQTNLFCYENPTYATLENVKQSQSIQPIKIDIMGYIDKIKVYPVDSIVTPPPLPEMPSKYSSVGYEQWPSQEVPQSVQNYNPQPEQQLQQPEEAKRPRKKRNLKAFASEWTCQPCIKSFKSHRGLIQHNNQHHSGPMPHGCSRCGKRFKEFERMQQHFQRHLMVDKPHKCFYCPKQFCRASDLQRHINLHHGQARYKCRVCGKPFDRADHVEDHELSHENGTVKKSYKKRISQTIYE